MQELENRAMRNYLAQLEGYEEQYYSLLNELALDEDEVEFYMDIIDEERDELDFGN